MESSGNKLISQDKIDLLEKNGFKWGGLANPGSFTRIRSYEEYFYIRAGIPYEIVIGNNLEKLEEIIARIDVNNQDHFKELKKKIY